ncbi:MAG: gamma-glutamyl-phosphate reductase, partial [Spartobacteria bacterium]
MSSLQDQIHHIGKNARAAYRALARLDSKTKNAVLIAMADELIVRLPDILEANAADVAEAEKNGLTKASI